MASPYELKKAQNQMLFYKTKNQERNAISSARKRQRAELKEAMLLKDSMLRTEKKNWHTFW